jgi:hypothetical protein
VLSFALLEQHDVSTHRHDRNPVALVIAADALGLGCGLCRFIAFIIQTGGPGWHNFFCKRAKSE